MDTALRARRPAAALGRRPAGPPGLSVVIPARNEAARIAWVLDLLFDSVRERCEVLVVVDSGADPTAAAVRGYAMAEPRLRLLVNGYGTGPAAAIRFGMDTARAPVIVVTTADGSEDPAQVEVLAALVADGAVVAAPSACPPRGLRSAGPASLLRAYSARYVRETGVVSRRGFEVGMELTAKARRRRLRVAGAPAIRPAGPPFWPGLRLARWLPAYLRWYLFCAGRPPRPLRQAG